MNLNERNREQTIAEYLEELDLPNDFYNAIVFLQDDYKILKQNYVKVLEGYTEKDMKCEELEDKITELKQEIRNLGGDISE